VTEESLPIVRCGWIFYSFLGYDLDEELPWHSTISRTRALYGEEVFKELFSKVLSLCVVKACSVAEGKLLIQLT
jgi:hypothetical protein